MAETKVTPDVAVPEVPEVVPAAEPIPAETTSAADVETTAPIATTNTAVKPAENAVPTKQKKSPLDIVKKLLARFKKDKKAETVTA